MKLLYLFILCILFPCLLINCNKLDENYSTNLNHKICFSTDTLSFDTILATVNSTTKQLMVYNKNNQPLNIESVILASPEKSGFCINVDGRKGSQFNNIRIAANDSMYIFVEITIDKTSSDPILLHEDSILFYTNGTKQKVILNACGLNVNVLKGGTLINNDTVFSSRLPYLIYDSLVISKNVTVNIEKGTTFYLHYASKIISNGTIIAKGTIESPIIFRGDRFDNIIEDLPYDRAPEQWGGITFGSESFGNILDNVIVKNGTTGITCLPSNPNRLKLQVHNSQITNMGDNLFNADNCYIEAINSEFSNTSGHVVMLTGGRSYFAHCTLVNYMTLKERKIAALSKTLCVNQSTSKNSFIEFHNCIIDGSHNPSKDLSDIDNTGEIKVCSSNNNHFLFNHCVIKLKETKDNRLKNVIFITDKINMNYKKTGGKENKYEFDFRPNNKDMAGIDKADLSISENIPFDRLGVNRTTHAPDIGAYEYIQTKTIQ